MNAAPNLRYIGLFATGYNNIDIAAAKEKGITVCNAGSYSTNAVTQQVIGYILMHYTKIPQYDAFVKQGGWKRSGVFSPLIFSGDEVYGKTLGIVGYGNIGKAVEKAARLVENGERPAEAAKLAAKNTPYKKSEIYAGLIKSGE